MKYRKKPIDVEAIVWDETKETLTTLINMGMTSDCYDSRAFVNYVYNLHIHTLEGSRKVMKGDYIIRGVKGEFYTRKPDIFEMTYEKIENI